MLSKKINKSFILFLGIIFSLLFAEISLRVGGLILLNIKEKQNLENLNRRGIFKILCIGESMTFGRYPSILEEKLNRLKLGIKFKVIDGGIIEATSEIILGKLEANLEKYQPDLVICMTGINDENYVKYHEDPEVGQNFFFKHFRFIRLIKYLLNNLNYKFFISTNLFFSDLFAENELSKDNDLEFLLNKIHSDKKKLNNYFLAAEYFLKNKKILQAEDILEKAVENRVNLEIRSVSRFVSDNFSEIYPEMVDKFERFLLTTIKKDPGNYLAYFELGTLYERKLKMELAEKYYLKSIEINPTVDLRHHRLANYYETMSQYKKSIEVWKQGAEFFSSFFCINSFVGNLYSYMKDYENAEIYYKKAIEKKCMESIVFGSLSTIYRKMGKESLAVEAANQAEAFRNNNLQVATKRNYHKIYSILKKRNIRLVAMQYPMRSLTPLKRIFEEEMKDIIFIDNEDIFKKAVKAKGYDYYFTDMFGGDFGHCSEEGNILMAENIARTLIKEYFKISASKTLQGL